MGLATVGLALLSLQGFSVGIGEALTLLSALLYAILWFAAGPVGEKLGDPAFPAFLRVIALVLWLVPLCTAAAWVSVRLPMPRLSSGVAKKTNPMANMATVPAISTRSSTR